MGLVWSVLLLTYLHMDSVCVGALSTSLEEERSVQQVLHPDRCWAVSAEETSLGCRYEQRARAGVAIPLAERRER